jgi:tetratricopeptide (TPR) repeat protein
MINGTITASLLLCIALLSAPAFGQPAATSSATPEPESDLVIPIGAVPDPSPTGEPDLAAIYPPEWEQQLETGFLLDRFEASTTVEDYLRNGQFEQAIEVAAVALELTEQQLGINSLELVPILNQMGLALVGVGRPEEAVAPYERSLHLIRNQVGLFAPTLVEPLFGLGLAYQDVGKHDDAIKTFQRAQHVTHRNQGVLNLEQIPIIRAITVSYTSKKWWAEAESLQLLTYKIHRHNFGDNKVEVVLAMFELAGWYSGIGDRRQARLFYRRGLRMMDEEDLEGVKIDCRYHPILCKKNE